MKKEMPESLKQEMEIYRAQGCWKVPQAYIDFHKTLADLVLIKLKAMGCKLDNVVMKSDGNGDHMLVVAADLTYKDEVKKICWHPGNQEFFEESESGGSFPMRIDFSVKKVI